MNLLITGGCGFIGSNFINYYFTKYPNTFIICLDAMYYCASINNIHSHILESTRFKYINGNINDYDLLVSIFKQYNITHIVHFAAQSYVDNSFTNSLQYTEDNVKGTHTILESIKNTNRDIFLLHFSTDEVYGESQLDSNMMKTESSILAPTNPYAASKAAAEMYVLSYICSFKLKALITRGNNVYGINQYPEKLIPRFIKLLRNNMKCTIHGLGDMVRNFIHVDDVCMAVDILLERGVVGEIYNIGSDITNEFSVIDIANILIEKICHTTEYNKYIEYIEDRPFNDKRYFISNDKLVNLGWKQTINFNDGINHLLN